MLEQRIYFDEDRKICYSIHTTDSQSNTGTAKKVKLIVRHTQSLVH